MQEERIRDLLMTNEAPQADVYAIVLGTSLNQGYPNVMLKPMPCRLEGLRSWRLFFPGMFVMVKTDQRPMVPIMRLGMLQPRDVNIILCYPYGNSPYAEFFGGLQKRIHELRKLGKIRQ